MNDLNSTIDCSAQGSAGDCFPVSEFRSLGKRYQLECITDFAGVKTIENQWQELERKCSEPFTYFQSFDWCYRWCESRLESDRVRREAELRVYVLKLNDDIVMIWPMMVLKSRSKARILTFLTDPLSQYANVLVDKVRVDLKTGRKAWKLIQKDAKVDAVTVNLYPHGSFLDSLFYGLGFVERSSFQASLLNLKRFKIWEDYQASLSRNQRKQRKRRRAKLEKQGDLTFNVSYGGSDAYISDVNIALEMKQRWLKNTGRNPGVLAEPETEQFLAGLTGCEGGQNGCPQGAVTLALCLDGEPIAIEIGMAKGSHYYSYLGAFDWDWKDYSPGKVQIEAAQKWAKTEGLEKFDFLGDPSEYKGEWTDETHQLHSRSIPITALGLVYCAIWKTHLRPKLKEAYKNMATDRRRVFSKLAEVAGRAFGKRESGTESAQSSAKEIRETTQ